MPVSEGLNDVFPFEVVRLRDETTGFERALILETVGGPGAFFDSEETGGVGEVIEEKEGGNCYDDGKDAFKDKAREF